MAKSAKYSMGHSMLPKLWRNVLILIVLAIIGAATLYGMHVLTAQRIARNERAWFAMQLEQLVPASLHDNDLLEDRIDVRAPDFLGVNAAMPIYRARLQGVPTAVIITSVAPDGYGGPITLLVGIRMDGTVLGVRILSHHETHNMGDDFEQPGSHWLDDFKQRSLDNPARPGWNVRKDGGEFEQFTSATITPRAIVHALRRTLDYFERHRDSLLKPAPHE